LAKLAKVADPDVPLEAHDDRAVDGGHHGDLKGVEETSTSNINFNQIF